MSAQTPGSFGLSVLLHAGAAGLVLFFTYANFHNDDDAPKILEMVAGTGTNFEAPEAPALGNSSTPVKAPAPLPPDPTPPPPAPVAAAPIQDAPPEPAAKLPPKPKPTPNPADILKSLERAEMRRKLNLERKYQKEKEAEARKAAADARKAALAKVKHVDAEGIKEGVLGGSTANKAGGASGKALSREEASEMDAYFAGLLAQIKAAHVPPADVSDNLVAKIEVFVAADGSVSRARIVGTSGNAAFDASVLEAIAHAHPLGPRPDGKSETVRFTFKLHEDDSQ